MSGAAAFRGQPLLLLGALLAAWLGLRVALWQPPFEDGAAIARLAEAAPSRAIAPAVRSPAPDRGEVAAASPLPVPLSATVVPWPEPPAPEPLPAWSAVTVAPEPAAPLLSPPEPAIEVPRAAPRFAVGHNLLLAAGLAQMEVPPVLLAYLQAARPTPGVPAAAPALAALPPRAPSALSRWSADGWLLLRRDTASPLLSGRPSYGRSQAGAVVRFALAPSSPLGPQAHVRASSALAGARERELAAGLSFRPVAPVPVRLVAEARASETARGTELRPAAYAVTEFAPLDLPLGMRGEAYAQAGYVGGAFATPFADGQARIERPLGRLAAAELRAGAGAWGGAQKGSARLDVGPTAAVTFRLGDARGRVAADYRFRVAGDAEPASGPALTLSAGF
ncbi:MAG TPA: hypothetical protein VEB68_11705 [Croceibacterium sp.]|nr:hypothetical protein [Croceibacterium sp.]